MSQEAAWPGAFKLCLVYAPADQKLYERLETYLKILERRSLIEFWNAHDIPAGSQRAESLMERLAAADLCMYLLSPDLLGSEYYLQTRPELIAERYRRGELRIVPVVLRPLSLAWLDPPFNELELLPTEKRPVTQWRDRDAALLNVVMGMERVIASMSGQTDALAWQSGEASSETIDTPFWQVPYRRNVYFTGRDDLLTTLRERFSSPLRDGWPAIQALTGLGGVGKTQVALEYAYRYRQAYQAVLWARADTPENLAIDGLLLAQTLHLPGCESADQEIVLGALKRWLEHHSDWLLILDNLADLDLLNTFLPLQYRGHVLLTTRIQATGAFASPLPALPLDEEAGARLLLRRARLLHTNTSEKEDLSPQYRQAQEIVRLLDGLPLALDQAGAYIEEMGESLEQYLHLYQQRHADLLSYRGRAVSGHPAPVSATFTLAFAQAEQLHPPAADLLRLCAFLHPATIPESLLLAETLSDESAGLLQGISDRAELNVALGVLLMFSLVRRSAGTHSLSVHRLVQVVIRDAMTEQEQRLWAERALALVGRAWPERGVAGWTRCQEYLPHALCCADLIAHLDLRSEEARHLLNEVGAYLSERAFYQEAERLLLQALNLSEGLCGVNDLATASVLQELGWLAHRRNQYAQAEERYHRALAIREQLAGPEHPQTAYTLYTLGLLHLNRRDLAQAAALLQRALTIQEQKLGSEHSQVAYTLNALGMLARVQEQYEQAEEFYRRALAIREKVLGADAPETATSVSNLAALAFNQGDYARAEPLYRRVLGMRERALGSEHPDTATTLGTLALLADLQRRYTEGISLARRALAIQEETSGREHRESAQTMMTLAMLYYHEGDFQQAEMLAREALAVRERILHAHDPNVVTSLNNLALIYRAQGKYEQARPLLQRALVLSEAAHGGEYSRTADIRANLATLPPQSELSADDNALNG